jgi:hypothetical protein
MMDTSSDFPSQQGGDALCIPALLAGRILARSTVGYTRRSAASAAVKQAQTAAAAVRIE